MPGVEGRSEEAPLAPLEGLLCLAFLPDLCESAAHQDADQLLVEVSFGVEGATGGDLGYVHPGDPFLACELDIGACAAQAAPGPAGYFSDVLYPIAFDDGDAFLLHPQ